VDLNLHFAKQNDSLAEKWSSGSRGVRRKTFKPSRLSHAKQSFILTVKKTSPCLSKRERQGVAWKLH